MYLLFNKSFLNQVNILNPLSRVCVRNFRLLHQLPRQDHSSAVCRHERVLIILIRLSKQQTLMKRHFLVFIITN